MLLKPIGFMKAAGGGGSYTQNVYDTQGTAYLTSTDTTTDEQTMEFSVWVKPAGTATAREYIFTTQFGCLFSLTEDDEFEMRLRKGTSWIADVESATILSTSSLNHIYVWADLSTATLEVRINGSTDANFPDDTWSTTPGASDELDANGNWGMMATDGGSSICDCEFADLWINFGGTQQGLSSFYGGGTPPDLSSLPTPQVHLGGSQAASNLNSAENNGSLSLTVGSGTFADV